MRIKETKQGHYTVYGWNTTGVTSFQRQHKTTGSKRDAIKIAREYINLGASHCSISQTNIFVFPK